ncbi:MAG: non-ribosomal peptide synthetase [Acidobacteria bacterium]|nr:non-ribosomal peptide synthetase [Acidobacteriota bacterium]
MKFVVYPPEKEYPTMPHHHLSCMADLLEQFRTSPERAILYAPGGPPLTARRLREVASQTAIALRSHGVGPADGCAIVLPNGPEMAVAFLSVAAVTTAAPLNPAYRQAEFQYYFQDLAVKAVLLQPGATPAAEAAARTTGRSIIAIQPERAAGAGYFTLSPGPAEDPTETPSVRPEQVALVLHTSGTTSHPKIVPLTHGRIFRSAANVAHSLQLGPVDRCLNVMPLFHIHGLIAALLASLVSGGGVICTSGFAAEHFPGWLDDFAPTWYTAVPTIHQSVLQVLADRPAPIRSTLRLARSSSAALPPSLLADLEQRLGVPVIEAYGMTEAAHQIASNPLPPRLRKPGSVGPAAGPEIAISSEDGRLLPPDTTGEIVVRGPNIIGAYAGQTEANRSAFFDGWFRTGDQGYLDSDGYLFITGRLKELINRGGQKISPREIDEALVAHPAVRQAVVFAVPHPRLGEGIAAAVVTEPGPKPAESELRRYLARKLAPYKVPQQIVFVDSIPKGPSGKLQRVGLADKLAGILQQPYEPPAGDREIRVAAVWRDVLAHEDAIGRQDNFFALGGDSLLAARIAVRLSRELGIRVESADIFENPTLSRLAARLGDQPPADELVDLLGEIENMSEDDVRQLLKDADGEIDANR